MTPATLAALLRGREAGVVLATRLPDGLQHVLPGADVAAILQDAAHEALAQDRARLVTVDSERWFLQPEAPAYRLLIVGAVHIAQALAPLAEITGLNVTIIDPRRGFARDDRFPGATLRQDWPDEALAALAPDRRTAIVTLTHDPKLDDPALDIALRSEAFFVGALGSRKTHASRLERLAALGHSPETLGRIRGPAGLPIGAITAAEIAVSILAELVAVRRGGILATR